MSYEVNNTVFDYIHLLRADGTKLVLYNMYPGKETGTYVDRSYNNPHYAIVREYRQNPNLREIYYKAGDGNTYYFREAVIQYNHTDSFGIDPNAMTTFYFEKVITPNDTISLCYGDYSGLQFGRNNLFRGVNDNISGDSLIVEYDFVTPYAQQSVNYMRILNKSANSEDMVFFRGDCSNLFESTQSCCPNKPTDPALSRSLYVKEIREKGGKTTYFNYEQNNKKFHYLDNYYIEYTINQLTQIKYPSGKVTDLTYLKVGDENSTYDFGDATNDFYISNWVKGTFRDQYTNIMLSNRICTNEYNINHDDYVNEDYIYQYSGLLSPSIMHHQPLVNGITTTILRKGKFDGTAPAESKVVKSFSRYLVNQKQLSIDFDSGAEFKLTGEDTYNNGLIAYQKIYTYEEGNLVGGMFYDGFLFPKQVKEIYKKDFESTKITNYAYSLETISAIGRKYPCYEKITDPLGKITEKWSSKQFGQYKAEPLSYFNINLPDSEMVTGSGIVQKYKRYKYYTDERIGKLCSAIDYSGNRQVETRYDYYQRSEDYASCGLPKSIEYNNGAMSRYFYYSKYSGRSGNTVVQLASPIKNISVDNAGLLSFTGQTISAKVLYSDGTTRDSLIIMGTSFQQQPLRTVTIYNKQNSRPDTLVYYAEYNCSGNTLARIIDENGFLTEYNYDNLNRITGIKTPGSFQKMKNLPSDTSYTYVSTADTIKQNYAFYSKDESCIMFSAKLLVSRYTYVPGPPPLDSPKRNMREDNSLDIKGENSTAPGLTNTSALNVVEEPNYNCFIEIDKTNSDYYNSLDLASAILTLHTGACSLSSGQTASLKIQGQSNTGCADVSGPEVQFSFFQNSTISVNITPIIEYYKSKSITLRGLRITTTASPSMNSSQKTFYFANIAPIISYKYKIRSISCPNDWGANNYVYNDILRTRTVIKRFNMDRVKPMADSTLEKYDAFGQLREIYESDTTGSMKFKALYTFNYMGLKISTVDALNRKVFNKYDFLGRPVETRFISQDLASPAKIMYYSPADDNYSNLDGGYTLGAYSMTTAYDEEGKKSKGYFDAAGNKVKQVAYPGGTDSLETFFKYNALGQLTLVASPKRMLTVYEYDKTGGALIKKHSADEDSVRYKYDKYGNLRVTLYRGASPTADKAVVFTKYDAAGRSVAIGYPDTAGTIRLALDKFNAMNPDIENTIEANASRYVVQNMYDSYNKTGAFAGMSDPAMATALSNGNLKGRLAATAFRDKLNDPWNYKVYQYDQLGRVSVQYTWLSNLNTWKKLAYEYDLQGNLKKVSMNPGAGDSYYCWYDYYRNGQLKEVKTNYLDAYATAKSEARYRYSVMDEVVSTSLKNSQGTPIAVNYTYDADRSWLRSVGVTDKFSESLTYYKNGNILTQLSSTPAVWRGNDFSFSYSYDGMNRLLSAVCPGNTMLSESFSYDADGNITQKVYEEVNRLSYSYDLGKKNRLTGVRKNGILKSISYDNQGNMLVNNLRSVEFQSYDHRNLPLTGRVISPLQSFTYKYDDNGNRTYKQTGSVMEVYFRDASGRELGVYDGSTGMLKMVNIYGGDMIGRINVASVRKTRTDGSVYYEYLRTSDDRNYYIKDHLGSVRLTIGQDGVIRQAQDYYAFGSSLRSYNNASVNSKYLFTSKERDTDTKLDYFGARYYDSEIGRWMSVDPLAHKYLGWSPYNYCMNNPLRNIDPDGNFVLEQSFQRKYPKFTALLMAANRWYKNERIVEGLKKYGQFSNINIENALSWGKGPSIIIKELKDAYGSYDPNINERELNINQKYIELYESAKNDDFENLEYLLGIILLHELVHYGDYQDRIDYPGEEGNEFEIEVFGKVINLKNVKDSKNIWENIPATFTESIGRRWECFYSPKVR